MIPGYRFRYPKYSHTEPITDTGFIPIFFIPIPIPGIGTWYRYLVSVSYRVSVDLYFSATTGYTKLIYIQNLVLTSFVLGSFWTLIGSVFSPR